MQFASCSIYSGIPNNQWQDYILIYYFSNVKIHFCNCVPCGMKYSIKYFSHVLYSHLLMVMPLRLPKCLQSWYLRMLIYILQSALFILQSALFILQSALLIITSLPPPLVEGEFMQPLLNCCLCMHGGIRRGKWYH